MDRQVIDMLRDHLYLPADISDEDIEDRLGGTRWEARAKFTIAMDELKAVLWDARPNWFRWLLGEKETS